jgi:hypothetical protein
MNGEKPMRLLLFIATLPLVGGTAVSARATDLTKIERSINKEPAYQGKPRYCLLVFGPEAKRRVWLVLDGDVLYVDLNGNGDLTEKGERVAVRELDGEITEPDRGIKHTGLRVTPQKDGGMVVSLMTEGKYCQRSGSVTFAARSREAPVLHFNGPVSVRFSSAALEPARGRVEIAEADEGRRRLLQQLGKEITLPGERPPNRAVSLCAVLGTPGRGEGTFVTYKARDILGHSSERIVVEAAFPNRNTTAKPVPVQGFLEPDS